MRKLSYYIGLTIDGYIAGAGTPMFGGTFSPTGFRHVVTHDLEGGQVSTFERV